jgi:ABC-type Fe3+/spermidine/putrescine transport system ATPase subunit
MRGEVKALHRRLGTTFVFVTHDQEEALTLSDRVAVMNEGAVEQIGTPREIYERPRTRFAADFMAVANLLRVTVEAVEDGRARLRAAGGIALLSTAPGFRVGESAWIGVRPERLRILGDGEPAASPEIDGVLEDRVYRGDRTDWRVRAGDLVLVVGDPGRDGFAPGGRVRVAVPADAVLRLEDKPGGPS